MKKSSGRLNLQNLIAIIRILKSMLVSGIAMETVLVVTFFSRYSTPICAFLRSQGLDVRVEHIDSEKINGGLNSVVIINCPGTKVVNYRPGSQIGDMRRNKKALLLPSALQIVVGHRDMGLAEFDPSAGEKFWQRLIKQHKNSGMVKNMRIGKGILEYEEVFCPSRYWKHPTSKIEAIETFDDMRSEEKEDSPTISQAADRLESLRLSQEVEPGQPWSAGAWRRRNDGMSANTGSNVMRSSTTSHVTRDSRAIDKDKLEKMKNSSWR
jgi:hypothetical protein